MFCIPVDIPPELCMIDDERKAIFTAKTACASGFLPIANLEINLCAKVLACPRPNARYFMSASVLRVLNDKDCL